MLVDTSGLLCLFDRREARNEAAVTYYGAAVVRITHNYVLAEFTALAPRRGVPRNQALEVVSDLQDDPEIEVIWIDEQLHREALELLQNRLDKDWSLCDAISILLMLRRGIRDALTTDGDFEQAGLQRLLPN